MKRIFFFLIALALCGGRGLLGPWNSTLALAGESGASYSTGQAQDAATEERLNKLNGLVQDLLEDKAHQKKQIESLAKEIQSLREQVSKPTGNYASQDDLGMLARKLQEIDQKRVEDNEKIVKKLEELGKTMSGPPPGKKPKPTPEPANNPNSGSATPEKGFEHTIASGDTLSTIAQAYKEKGIKVTADQIQKANPGLKEKSLRVGQKIFIPAPQP